MHKSRWSDLEFVLAVARDGSAAAAARALNVNHTTVIRRIRAYEDRLSEPVFEHRSTGYRLTKKGESFLEAAQSIEATLADLERKVSGGDLNLRGNIAITTTDSVFPIVAPDIAAFQQAYPEVTVSVTATTQRLDLFNRTADIAIRPSDQPPADLVGRRVGKLDMGIYAAQPFVAAATMGTLSDVPWLGVDEPIRSTLAGYWLDRNIPENKISARADSFMCLRGLAEAGLGCTLLPCHLGDASDRLQRIFHDALDLTVDLWMLSHKDILRSRRVTS